MLARRVDLAVLKRLGVCKSVTYVDRILERLPAVVAEFDCDRFAEAFTRCPIDGPELTLKLKVLLTLRHRAVVFYCIDPFR